MSKSPDAFRTIREVADWLGVAAHVLRFWESKFNQIRPVKRAGGRRYYRPADMEIVGGIKVLLHDRGMTVRGVQRMLREEGVAAVAALSPPLDSIAVPPELLEGIADEAAWEHDARTDTPARGAAEAETVPDDAPSYAEPEPEPEPVTEPEPVPEREAAGDTAPVPGGIGEDAIGGEQDAEPPPAAEAATGPVGEAADASSAGAPLEDAPQAEAAPVAAGSRDADAAEDGAAPPEPAQPEPDMPESDMPEPDMPEPARPEPAMAEPAIAEAATPGRGLDRLAAFVAATKREVSDDTRPRLRPAIHALKRLKARMEEPVDGTDG